jgi:hypothetical protein
VSFDQVVKEQRAAGELAQPCETVDGLYTMFLHNIVISEQKIQSASAQGIVTVGFTTIFKKMGVIWGFV